MKVRVMLAICCLCGTTPAGVDALTVEEILRLKQNGVSDQTIEMMLKSENMAGQVTSGGEKMGVRTIVRPGGQSAIVYSTGSGDQEARDAEARLEEERAWEMLRHIIVDTRGTKD
jgi:hypothetical protein